MPHVHDTTHIYMTYVCFTTDNYYTCICIWHNTHDIHVLIHGMCYVLCGLHYVLCSLCGLLICGMNPTHTYTYQRIYDRCMFYYWQLLHMYMTYMCWYAAWITCYVLCVINVTWHTAYNRNTSSKCDIHVWIRGMHYVLCVMCCYVSCVVRYQRHVTHSVQQEHLFKVPPAVGFDHEARRFDPPYHLYRHIHRYIHM